MKEGNDIMTIEEAVEYFLENEELFSPSQEEFLRSIIKWGAKHDVSEKQVDAFISTVDAVSKKEQRFLKRAMQAINKVK